MINQIEQLKFKIKRQTAWIDETMDREITVDSITNE